MHEHGENNHHPRNVLLKNGQNINHTNKKMFSYLSIKFVNSRSEPTVCTMPVSVSNDTSGLCK